MSDVAQPRTLAQWLAFIETLHPKSIAMGLERIASVAARMGIRIDCPVVTVAGTNGKGSTCAIVEAIYRHAGYRTGLYTSPHLLRFNERVRIDGIDATDEALVEAFEAVETARAAHPDPLRRGEREPSASEAGERATPLTYFEFSTLAALRLFAEARLDVLILEVGLGGRLDAVNIVDPDVAIVTTVDIDHVDWLGSTRDAIGREKAGVFRTGKPALCGDPDPPRTLVEHAEAIGALLWRIGVDYRYEAERTQWRYDGPGGARYGLPLPALRGDYQLRNAATALAAIDALHSRLPVAAGAVRDGLVNVELPGRLQVLPGRPSIVLDVAHNAQAARVLADALSTMGYFPRTFAVFGMLADKDIEAVVRALAPRIDCWYVAPLPGARGASVTRLESALAAAAIDAQSIRPFGDVADAFAAARNDAHDTDRIAAFGSFLTVAAVLAAARARRGPVWQWQNPPTST
ncbi:MAG TPA: folylpolyglutamate synthase/dihydrofolate synthase family protein [Casimicrobiaceae bacterium]|nr:folylpolyglutamate synthase/dihydrofolate synthase family protein [Casimicrobiaceae bacterium]